MGSSSRRHEISIQMAAPSAELTILAPLGGSFFFSAFMRIPSFPQLWPAHPKRAACSAYIALTFVHALQLHLANLFADFHCDNALFIIPGFFSENPPSGSFFYNQDLQFCVFIPAEQIKKQRCSLRKFRMKTPLPSCLVSIMWSNITQINPFVNGFCQVFRGNFHLPVQMCPGENTNFVRQSFTAPGHIEEVSYLASITT